MNNLNQLTVIVDADAIVAQVSITDSNYQKAGLISEKLKKFEARIVYPATAVTEAVTVLQKKQSSAIAYGTANILIVGGVEIADVNYLTLLTAMNYFKPAGSKKNTLFDCIIMAVADRYETDIIFSFDKIYKKQGYRLVSDL